MYFYVYLVYMYRMQVKSNKLGNGENHVDSFWGFEKSGINPREGNGWH